MVNSQRPFRSALGVFVDPDVSPLPTELSEKRP